MSVCVDIALYILSAGLYLLVERLICVHESFCMRRISVESVSHQYLYSFVTEDTEVPVFSIAQAPKIFLSRCLKLQRLDKVDD